MLEVAGCRSAAGGGWGETRCRYSLPQHQRIAEKTQHRETEQRNEMDGQHLIMARITGSALQTAVLMFSSKPSP
jgi:hypothetical protein